MTSKALLLNQCFSPACKFAPSLLGRHIIRHSPQKAFSILRLDPLVSIWTGIDNNQAPHKKLRMKSQPRSFHLVPKAKANWLPFTIKCRSEHFYLFASHTYIYWAIIKGYNTSESFNVVKYKFLCKIKVKLHGPHLLAVGLVQVFEWQTFKVMKYTFLRWIKVNLCGPLFEQQTFKSKSFRHFFDNARTKKTFLKIT